MQQAKCKITRRLGTSLFPKCEKVFARRPYPPGQKKKKTFGQLSEYGKEVREKQKLRYLYNLKERQFRNYVRETLAMRAGASDAAQSLIQLLELRLDNSVFRSGFASTRQQARQMISHGHFLVNGTRTTVPSYRLRRGDVITLRPQSKTKTLFKDLGQKIKGFQPPTWLELDKTNSTVKVTGAPSLEEAIPPVEMSAIFEFYSR